MNIQRQFISAAVVLLLCAATLSAADYYVDANNPAARDSNSGTLSAPWRTVSHAVETAAAGDTVYVRAGVYHEQLLTVRDGDTRKGPIVFAAFPGERPVIDGNGVETGSNGILISHAHISIRGFEIRNWICGVWMEFASFIELTDCEVHQCAFGVGASFGTHDFVLNRVLMHHFDLYGFDASPGGGLDCYNGILNDCIAHTGRDRQQNVDGFALGHGTQHGFRFNRCTAYNVFDGFDISSRETVLSGCLAYDCWNGAYKLWQDDVTLVNCIGYGSIGANVELDWDGEPGTTTLMNCTLYDAHTYNIWIENSRDSLVMHNTILAGGRNIGLAFEMMGVENYRGDYNIFHNVNPHRAVAVAYTDEFSADDVRRGAWTAYSGQDRNSIVVTDLNALFADAAGYDLRLSPSGPAIDRGTADGAPAVDFNGEPRPSGRGYDIGAYER